MKLAAGEASIAPGSLQEARQALLGAAGRDEVIQTILDFVRRSFDYAAVFSVSSGELRGWDAAGPFSRDAHRAQVRKVAACPPWGSIFRSSIDIGGQVLGPGPTHEFDRVLLADLGRESPANVLLIPVRLRGRTALVLYADNGRERLDPEAVVDTVTLCAALPAILESLIRRRKEHGRRDVASEKELLSGVADALVDAPFEPSALEAPLTNLSCSSERVEEGRRDDQSGEPLEGREPLEIEIGEVLEEKERPDAPGPAATHPSRPRQDSPDVIAERLALGGEAEPALLVALAAHGDEGARALVSCFPGPTRAKNVSFAAMDKDPMAHGPVVAAMAFLGPAATETLLSLTRSSDPEARLYAVFLFSIAPDSGALSRLLEMLSDSDPRVATAARSAIMAHRGMPGFLTALSEIRGELGRRDDPLRLCDVLRASAHLTDKQAIPRIVDLLDHGDNEVVDEAEAALVAITKQSFGRSQRRWLKWFHANKNRSRLAWLVDGLSHRSLEIRESALLELSEQVGETFDFVPDGPRGDRAAAVERWMQWLEARGVPR